MNPNPVASAAGELIVLVDRLRALVTKHDLFFSEWEAACRLRIARTPPKRRNDLKGYRKQVKSIVSAIARSGLPRKTGKRAFDGWDKFDPNALGDTVDAGIKDGSIPAWPEAAPGVLDDIRTRFDQLSGFLSPHLPNTQRFRSVLVMAAGLVDEAAPNRREFDQLPIALFGMPDIEHPREQLNRASDALEKLRARLSQVHSTALAVEQETENDSDYQLLTLFPKSKRDSVRKAGEKDRKKKRVRRIKRDGVWLYHVGDARTWGWVK